ncbi:MAG: PASTA domain-containing protein [Roseobacter sp.]
MADKSTYDPKQIIEDDLTLSRTTDGMNASALKHQTFLHRQRAGAAKVRLSRALRRGASQEEIDVLQSNVISRQARLVQVETQFAAADIVSPVPESDAAQVLGHVTGRAGEGPLVAALLSANGEVVASARIGENAAFVLRQEAAISDVMLQISDVNQAVLFRDAKSFSVAPGQVLTRTVPLEEPVKPTAPPPTRLSMPDVVGQTEAAACAILFRLGVRDIDVSARPSAGPAGVVLEQGPEAGSTLVPDNGAKLIVSQVGEITLPARVDMPDLIGLSVDQARAVTRDLGIKMAEVSRADAATKGQIIAQSPEAGAALSAPLTATMAFSEGLPEGTAVPLVVGEPAEKADAILREVGFTVVRRTVRLAGQAGIVVEQKPKAGELAVLPTSVAVVVNLGEETTSGEVQVPNLVGRTVTDATRIASVAGLEIKVNTIRTTGSTGVVLEQKPVAGDRARTPSVVEVVVNSGREIITPRDTSSFARDFGTEVAKDERLERAGMTSVSARDLIVDLGVSRTADVEGLIALDNADLMSKLGLRDLNAAKTFRSVMRGAIERME